MYKPSTKIILGVALMLLTNKAIAHDTVENFTLSSTSQSSLENRLGVFLDTIDTYDTETQIEVYQNLQTRISTYETRYSVNSDIYTMLQIIDLIADHKLDPESILTNQEILSHIIYGNSYPHYREISPQEDKEEMNRVTPSENESNIGENNPVYRADLFTDNLNEVDKNILAGTAKGVLQLEVRANLEGIKSETVEFRFNENIDNIGIVGKLYHNGILMGESSQSDARGTVLTIDSLDDFIIGTQTSYVQLEIVTQAIGKEEIGKALENIRVVSTTFSDNTGVITGDKIGDRINTTVSKNFSIVPADIIVSVESEFEKNISTSEILIVPQVGTNNNNGDTYSAKLNNLTLRVSSFKNAGDITVFNSRGTQIGSTTINSSGDINIPIISDTISSGGEIYRITTTVEALFRISQDGISYSVGNDSYSSNLESQLLLGQR